MTLTDKSIEFYNKLYNRRRGWNVIQPDGDQVLALPQGRSTLSKALALSQLEIPVGNFITNELIKTKDLPTSLVTLLEANIADELKHDEVLNNLRRVLPVDAEDDLAVSKFVAEAERLANLYSPVVVAAVLESSIFFVILPMLRFMGSSACRTISSDISNDETLHVSTNIQLSKDLGYRRGKALNTLRGDIMAWLTSDLDKVNDNKYLTSDFWLNSSQNLYDNGKASGLSNTKKAIMPSFFEIKNTNLPVYN